LTGAGAWAAAGGDVAATRTLGADVPLDGEVAWRIPLQAQVTTPIVTDGYAVYVSLADARLVAYSVEDGRELWSSPARGQLDVPPALDGESIYVSLRSGTVEAIEAATGDIRWRYE